MKWYLIIIEDGKKGNQKMTLDELKLLLYILNDEVSESDFEKAREIIKREIRLKTEDFRKDKQDVTSQVK